MITQGSNLPLYFSNIPISLDSIDDVSAGIYTQKDGKELKHWSKDDLTVTENGILAPITQAESMGLPVGFCYVELKFTDNSGMIPPGIRVMEHVSRRDDKTELSGEQPQTLRYVDIDCSNVLTDVGAVVGASAYELAVKNGFEGTEEEWLDSLVGGSGSGTASLADWVKQPEPPKYTAEDVGADTLGTADKLIKEHDESDTAHPVISQAIAKIAADVGGKEASGTAESKVSAHNTATDAHNDIRLLVQGLAERLNALADSDDTTLDQMSEVVAYTKSNKSLIDAITASKVSVSDIIDNLTTNVANKPLSAAQGVKLKALIDAIVIPEKLPNPNALTINLGQSAITYDGSGAVTVSIPDGNTERIEKGSTDTAVELEPNKLYVFPEMSALTLTFASPENASVANEYHVIFQSGTTATTLTLPDAINVPNGFTVEANKVYELSVLEENLCAQSWEVTTSA